MISPIGTISVSDALASARNLIQDVAIQDVVRINGVMLYNMTISELYSNLTQLADYNDYLITKVIANTTAYRVGTSRKLMIPTSDLDLFHQLVGFALAGNRRMVSYSVLEFDSFYRSTILTNSENDRASYPFDMSGIATVMIQETLTEVPGPAQKKIVAVAGENVSIAEAEKAVTITYLRKPILASQTGTDLGTIKIDAADKYYDLIVLRMASLAELQKGVTDRSLTLVRLAYETMFAGLEPNAKARLMSIFNKEDENANRNK